MRIEVSFKIAGIFGKEVYEVLETDRFCSQAEAARLFFGDYNNLVTNGSSRGFDWDTSLLILDLKHLEPEKLNRPRMYGFTPILLPLIPGELFMVAGNVMRYVGPWGIHPWSAPGRRNLAFRHPDDPWGDVGSGYATHLCDHVRRLDTKDIPMLRHRIKQLEARGLCRLAEEIAIKELEGSRSMRSQKQPEEAKSVDRAVAKERLTAFVKSEKLGKAKSSYSEMWDRFNAYTEELSEADIDRIIAVVLGDL